MFKKTALLAALVLSSGIALAEGNWYIGAGVGHASVDVDEVMSELDVVRRFATSFHSSKNDSDTSYKLFGGYKYNKNFAVEAGYADFGQFEARASGNTGGTSFSAKGMMDSNAFFVDAVGILPLNDSFSVFGKAGLAYAHTKAKYSETVASLAYSESGSDDEFVPKLGIGAEYNITKLVAVRAEYEHYFNVGDKFKTGVESDIGGWNIGLKISF